MHVFFKTTMMIAAVAALGAVVVTGTAQQALAQATGTPPAAQKEKKVKDAAESDIWNEASKDGLAKNYTKEIADLDTWKQKYPDSDFKDVRTLLYVQAYKDSGQLNKAVDTAAELLNKNLDTVFDDPKTGPQNIIQLLFGTTQAILQLCAPAGNPTPEELATGDKAARMLLEFNKKPEGIAQADWDTARGQLQAAAKAAILSIAVKPADMALAKNDCETAQNLYTKALGDYPDKSFISYNLGRALSCIAKAKPDQATQVYPKALYSFVRAAVIDPSLGGSFEAKKIVAYADDAYKKYHGGDEGLQQLKDLVKGSPLPPAGFSIETEAARLARQEEEFKAKYPQLAQWLAIKKQLTDATTGMQYFEGSLKDAAGVPKLKGVLLEGKPACRSKELLVAIPLPDQQGSPQAEIALKLDAPLTGKPETGVEIQWEGIPSAFTQSPNFMLTMATEKAKIDGLKTSACAVPVRGGAKKGTTKKKK